MIHTTLHNLPTVRRLHVAVAALVALFSGGMLRSEEPSAVAGTRTTNPSARAYVSTQLVNHFLARAVAEDTPVREYIMNAWTHGHQSTRANLSIRTLPDSQRAAFELILAGQSHCPNSVSRKGPATVYSSSITAFDARARLTFANDVLRVESVAANSDTSAELGSVESSRAILQPLVRRMAQRKLPQVEAAASDRHAERVTEKLRSQVDELVAKANEAITIKARQPMREQGAWPTIRLASDASGIFFEAAPLSAEAPGAKPQPPTQPDKTDFFLCVHDSILEQMVEKFLGGREVTDVQVLNVVQMLTAAAPRHLWVHDRAERWSVVLAKSRPVRVSFREGAIHVVVDVRETIRDGQRIESPLRVSATFDAQPTPDGLVLVRQGELKMEFYTAAPALDENESLDEALNVSADKGAGDNSADDKGTESLPLRVFLERKFGAIFPEEFHFDALAPPSGGFGEKFRRVQPQTISFEEGWGAISYQVQNTK